MFVVKNGIYLRCLVPVAPDSSGYRVWFLSARDVYYRFTLHYKKENLVAERNLGGFFITFVPGILELSLDSTMKILIDNGHGHNTPGKRSPDGTLLEAAYNREIAQLILAKLHPRQRRRRRHPMAHRHRLELLYLQRPDPIRQTSRLSLPSCNKKLPRQAYQN